MPFRVEIKRILDSDQGQIQLALAMGYVVTRAPPTRRGRTYLKKTYISGPAPRRKAVAVPAGGVGFDMSALSAALDDVADAVAPAQEAAAQAQAQAQAQAAAGAGAGAGAAAGAAAAAAPAALEWGGEGHIALEVNDDDVDGLIAAMGGVSMGGKRKGKGKGKSRKGKSRKNRTRKH